MPTADGYKQFCVDITDVYFRYRGNEFDTYDVNDKYNNVSFEGLNKHYH